MITREKGIKKYNKNKFMMSKEEGVEREERKTKNNKMESSNDKQMKNRIYEDELMDFSENDLSEGVIKKYGFK